MRMRAITAIALFLSPVSVCAELGMVPETSRNRKRPER